MLPAEREAPAWPAPLPLPAHAEPANARLTAANIAKGINLLAFICYSPATTRYIKLRPPMTGEYKASQSEMPAVAVFDRKLVSDDTQAVFSTGGSQNVRDV